MATPQVYLEQRLQDDWLVGGDRQVFSRGVATQLQAIQQCPVPSPVILLAQREPVQCLAGFMAACIAAAPVVLGNPDWGDREWQQVFQQVQPHLIWADAVLPPHSSSPPATSALSPGSILIATGGSSGRLKFAIHTWDTLMASVRGMQTHFQVETIHSYCVLPLYHVSGLMQFMRSFTSGGQLVVQPFRELLVGHWRIPNPEGWFLSLVPTQLQRLLDTATAGANVVDWLTQFGAILLGGGAAWPQLLEQARSQQLPLAPTYGMTEMASQVATLAPQAFLAGQNHCGPVLPHVQVRVCDRNGLPLGPHQVGSLRLQGQSLMRGYLGNPLKTDGFYPDDVGFLDAQGHLHLVGRNSTKIITGGENVFPEEVEAVIRTTGLVTDVCVLGLPDEYWGEVVTAVYVAQENQASTGLDTQLKRAIASQLSKYKQPKHWIAVDHLPRNAQGKLNRQQLRNWVQGQYKGTIP